MDKCHEAIENNDFDFIINNKIISDKQKLLLIKAFDNNGYIKINHGKQKWSLLRLGLINFTSGKTVLTEKGKLLAIRLKDKTMN